MLVRVFNYPRAAVDELARLAVEGGQRGIILCPKS
jgi:PTS system ascorbate-specific IIA component